MATTQKPSWFARWYGNAPSPTSANADREFHALYPVGVWKSMTPVEQAQARAIWEGQQSAGRRTSTALWVIFVIIPVFVVLVGGLIWFLVEAGR